MATARNWLQHGGNFKPTPMQVKQAVLWYDPVLGYASQTEEATMIKVPIYGKTTKARSNVENTTRKQRTKKSQRKRNLLKMLLVM